METGVNEVNDSINVGARAECTAAGSTLSDISFSSHSPSDHEVQDEPGVEGASSKSASRSKTRRRRLGGGHGRHGTLYDAVAGRIGLRGAFIVSVAGRRGALDSDGQLDLSQQHGQPVRALSPGAALFSSSKAPRRKTAGGAIDTYDCIRLLGRRADGTRDTTLLPDGELCMALQTFASDFYGSLAAGGEANEDDVKGDWASLDETALLALGMLVEEWVEEWLSQGVHLLDESDDEDDAAIHDEVEDETAEVEGEEEGEQREEEEEVEEQEGEEQREAEAYEQEEVEEESAKPETESGGTAQERYYADKLHALIAQVNPLSERLLFLQNEQIQRYRAKQASQRKLRAQGGDNETTVRGRENRSTARGDANEPDDGDATEVEEAKTDTIIGSGDLVFTEGAITFDSGGEAGYFQGFDTQERVEDEDTRSKLALPRGLHPKRKYVRYIRKKDDDDNDGSGAAAAAKEKNKKKKKLTTTATTASATAEDDVGVDVDMDEGDVDMDANINEHDMDVDMDEASSEVIEDESRYVQNGGRASVRTSATAADTAKTTTMPQHEKKERRKKQEKKKRKRNESTEINETYGDDY